MNLKTLNQTSPKKEIFSTIGKGEYFISCFNQMLKQLKEEEVIDLYKPIMSTW